MFKKEKKTQILKILLLMMGLYQAAWGSSLTVPLEKYKTELRSANPFSPEGSSFRSLKKDLAARSFQRNFGSVQVSNATASDDSNYSFSISMKKQRLYSPVFKLDFPEEFGKIFQQLISNSFDYKMTKNYYNNNICIIRIENASLLGKLKDIDLFTENDFFLFKSSFYFDEKSNSILMRCEVEQTNPNESRVGRNLISPM